MLRIILFLAFAIQHRLDNVLFKSLAKQRKH
jgi:hypothetical protein